MKKVLIFMMLMSAIIASAQTGWDIKMESADPLKGTIERTRYKWQEGETMVFGFYNPGTEWKVGVGRNTFKPDPRGLTKNNNFLAYATVGIYDADGNIIEAWDNFHMELTDMYRVATAMEDSKKQRVANKKIIEHLLIGHGYVRILMDTHFGNGFDMKIPCLLDCN
jgi:hypothetical protein